MADKGDITGVRITSSVKWASRLADDIANLDGYTVIKRLETPLSNRPVPGLRVHLTVLHGYPPAARIHAWLAASGWENLPPGPAGAMWSKGAARVGVPDGDEWEDITSGALRRIAAAERMTVSQLVAAIHVGQEGKPGDG